MKGWVAFVSCSLLFSLAFLVGVEAFAQETVPVEEAQPSMEPKSKAEPTKGELKIAERAKGKIKGSFGSSGSLVEFDSQLVNPSDSSTKRVTKTHIKVNGLPVEFTRDLEAQVVIVDGHDKALFKEDKEALTALSAKLNSELARTLPSSEGGSLSTAPPQEDLLYRSVQLLAEAPVGYTLSRDEIKKPKDIRKEQPPEPGSPAFGPPADPQEPEGNVPVGQTRPTPVLAKSPGIHDGQHPLASESPVFVDAPTTEPGVEACQEAKAAGDFEMVKVACQVSDQDGIFYFTCGTYDRWLTHDAWHCFSGDWVYSGLWEKNCLSRCGPGCGDWTRWGVYSLDCGEHDTCCGIHGGCVNPWDSECGDEFGEARDDTIWGDSQCGR